MYGYQRGFNQVRCYHLGFQNFYCPKSIHVRFNLYKTFMKTIFPVLAVVLFLGEPIQAQEREQNALQAKFNYLMPLPKELISLNTYHRSGLGFDCSYDWNLLSKIGLGISLKAGLQRSPLSYYQDPILLSCVNNNLTENQINLNAFRLGLGPYFYERVADGLYLLTKFYLGYNFMNIEGAGAFGTSETELVLHSMYTALYKEFSSELLIEINDRISISMGGQLSLCTYEFKDAAHIGQTEKVNFHNLGFSTGFRIKM